MELVLKLLEDFRTAHPAALIGYKTGRQFGNSSRTCQVSKT